MQQNYYDLLAVMEDLSFTTLTYLREYENYISKETNIKETFQTVDFVYMQVVLLNLSKLLSLTNSDKAGLSQLERFGSSIHKQEIVNFRDKYKDIIEKIKSNRNRIISHVDISGSKAYYKMTFSKDEIERKILDRKKYLSSA
jgi:hypothetical protein